eukprot:m.10845 g.10845  ORF g.10845 m.10845 type:complete len:105 (+) comp9692_c0_seq1:76-390(+)
MSHRDYVASTSAGSEERDKELESAMAKACATMAEMHPEHPLRCTLKDEAKMVLGMRLKYIENNFLFDNDRYGSHSCRGNCQRPSGSRHMAANTANPRTTCCNDA